MLIKSNIILEVVLLYWISLWCDSFGLWPRAYCQLCDDIQYNSATSSVIERCSKKKTSDVAASQLLHFDQTTPRLKELICNILHMCFSVRGCSIDKGEHKRLFMGHKMTQHSAESAAHAHHCKGRKKPLLLRDSSHHGPQLMSHNSSKGRSIFLNCILPGLCQNDVLRLEMKCSS